MVHLLVIELGVLAASLVSSASVPDGLKGRKRMIQYATHSDRVSSSRTYPEKEAAAEAEMNRTAHNSREGLNRNTPFIAPRHSDSGSWVTPATEVPKKKK